MLGYLLMAAFAACVVLYFVHPGFKTWVNGKKTMVTATSVGVLGFLQQLDLTQIVAKENIGWWLLGIGVTFAVLRTVTVAPIRWR